jgi:isopenicillin-N epimerase
VHPLVTSHGATSSRRDRNQFHLEFDWVGTVDPTSWLAVPAALETLGAVLPGGWPEVRRRNHEMALTARRILCDALGIDPPAPESMIGSLVAVPLPPRERDPHLSPAWLDGLQQVLYEEYTIEVPIFAWPNSPARLVRVSAQLYNEPGHYEHLARSLQAVL